MNKLLFAFPENDLLASKLSHKFEIPLGKLTVKHFPDWESYVRMESDVSGKEIFVLCTLHDPDSKIMPLFFLCRTLKESGASKITLIAPYLAYMRQDTRFNQGEAISCNYFASFVSSFVDKLVTIDPHLHRKNSLSEVYTIPTLVLQSAPLIAEYVAAHIEKPLLIGPDSESGQWVKQVADIAETPFLVAKKTRFGDTNVKVEVPDLEKYKFHKPVIIDDIISTAQTMIEAVKHITKAGMLPPICIGVHAIFAADALHELKVAGAGDVLTCNTIEHASNAIDLSSLFENVFIKL